MVNHGLKLKYFVLNPTKDDEYGQASRLALLAYAKSVAIHNPELANDLRHWEIGCRHNIAERALILKETRKHAN